MCVPKTAPPCARQHTSDAVPRVMVAIPSDYQVLANLLRRLCLLLPSPTAAQQDSLEATVLIFSAPFWWCVQVESRVSSVAVTRDDAVMLENNSCDRMGHA